MKRDGEGGAYGGPSTTYYIILKTINERERMKKNYERERERNKAWSLFQAHVPTFPKMIINEERL